MVATGPGIRGNRECQEKLPRIKSSQWNLQGGRADWSIQSKRGKVPEGVRTKVGPEHRNTL